MIYYKQEKVHNLYEKTTLLRYMYNLLLETIRFNVLLT